MHAPFPVAGAGAVVDFFGNVRPLENDAPISALEYEAHPKMAKYQLQLLAEEAADRFNLLGIKLHHRIGRVPAGETSLFLRVATGHRQEGFEAAKWIVDELKVRVPIWKNPVWETVTRPARKRAEAIPS